MQNVCRAAAGARARAFRPRKGLPQHALEPMPGRTRVRQSVPQVVGRVMAETGSGVCVVGVTREPLGASEGGSTC